jgi:hypothetical protein
LSQQPIQQKKKEGTVKVPNKEGNRLNKEGHVIHMFSIFFHIFLYTNPTTAMARLSVFSIKEKIAICDIGDWHPKIQRLTRENKLKRVKG